MSFSSDVKTELCQARSDRLCCARAAAYGALLYGNTFTPREVRVITESGSFASRLPVLLDRAFGLAFDRLPGAGERVVSVRHGQPVHHSDHAAHPAVVLL